MIKIKSYLLLLLLVSCINKLSNAQVLTLNEAVRTGLQNYASIKAKGNYIKSSQATVEQTKREALPNLILSLQQDYGTVNGSNGPLYGLGGYGVSSSGAALESQNWNSAFGALYLTNINWDFYTFGRVKERIKTAQSVVARDETDLQQELFQHEIRVAAAYLNLLAAQRITRSQENNLNRADTFKLVVTTRAKNGLIAGIDSSLANAEVSNAKLALIRAKDAEQERTVELARLMGIAQQSFVLDTLFITKIPATLIDTASKLHPLLEYYKSRIKLSDQQAKYYSRLKYPTLSAFGVFQSRGSGFKPEYVTDQKAYSQSYLTGINPIRSNYLLGVGLTWNITSIWRVNQQVAAQKFASQALQDEYQLVNDQIKAQQTSADNKMKNSADAYKEVPVQIKAASDAFLQRTVMYKNGLSNIVDVTQALYTLNRAETDRDIAYSNVWQALLLKAAATGNFELFSSQIR